MCTCMLGIVSRRQLMGTHLEAPKTTMPNISAIPDSNFKAVGAPYMGADIM